MQFQALVVDSIRESLHRKIFWVMVAITLLVVAAMACVGFGPDGISLFFGLWDIPTQSFDRLSGLGRTRIVGLTVYLLLDLFLGWVGVLLMIVATAGVFPSMMQRGAIDVLVSKPIGRRRLFVYKYLSVMVFALLQGTLFVGLTFLVMGVRWGVWVPAYLLAIPLLVLLFSYVYCVSVLVAVKTRSTVAAILLSVSAWALFVVPPTAVAVFDSQPSLQEYRTLYRIAQVVSWIPPKTQDFAYLVAKQAEAGTSVDLFPDFLVDDTDGEAAGAMDRAREIDQRQLQKSPWYSIGSSLIFEAIVVLMAMFSFARKDF